MIQKGNRYIIIIGVLLLMACGEKKSSSEKQLPQVENLEELEKKNKLLDSLSEAYRKAIIEKEMKNAQERKKQVEKNKKRIVKQRQGKSSRSYSSSHRNRKGYDNMRGFDPASEDDMDDNGMSRYMENNDEEGWD